MGQNTFPGRTGEHDSGADKKDEKSGLTPEYSTLFEKLVVRAVAEG